MIKIKLPLRRMDRWEFLTAFTGLKLSGYEEYENLADELLAQYYKDKKLETVERQVKM